MNSSLQQSNMESLSSTQDSTTDTPRNGLADASPPQSGSIAKREDLVIETKCGETINLDGSYGSMD